MRRRGKGLEIQGKKVRRRKLSLSLLGEIKKNSAKSFCYGQKYLANSFGRGGENFSLSLSGGDQRILAKSFGRENKNISLSLSGGDKKIFR